MLQIVDGDPLKVVNVVPALVVIISRHEIQHYTHDLRSDASPWHEHIYHISSSSMTIIIITINTKCNTKGLGRAFLVLLLGAGCSEGEYEQRTKVDEDEKVNHK